jgi:hypothetical protein
VIAKVEHIPEHIDGDPLIRASFDELLESLSCPAVDRLGR